MRRLSLADAASELARYERRNALIGPLVPRALTELADVEHDGSAHARRRIVERLPVVAFRPRAADEAESAV